MSKIVTPHNINPIETESAYIVILLPGYLMIPDINFMKLISESHYCSKSMCTYLTLTLHSSKD